MSESSPDPLELLRQYTMQKKPIELLDSSGTPTKDLLQAVTVRFGDDASFPRDQPTSYLRTNSDSDYYQLSALLHYLDHHTQSFYEYMKLTNPLGLQTVSFGDRVALQKYLLGETDKPPSVVAAGGKHAADTADESGRRVRPKTGTEDSGVSVGDLKRRERVLVTTCSALSSGKSFARVPELIRELFPDKFASKTDGKKHAGVVSEPQNAQSQKAGLRRSLHHNRKRNPIIVVPAATTAMINMYNVQSLLQDHQFMDTNQLMAKGLAKPREVFVEHMMSRSSQQVLKFRIVDSVQDFTEADWNSLVCVFTQGAAWQFKNWVWKTPEEVFRNTLGLYPKYHDERPKDTVKSWGVMPLNIERSKRHVDRATVIGLWSNIEQFLARQKPEFLS
ncbi:accessory factor associated with RNA polymerase II [Coemansia sp. Benny D115]|nr:accessory factor associated with RNA polymerase II [Coemansia sp. Benny D115]